MSDLVDALGTIALVLIAILLVIGAVAVSLAVLATIFAVTCGIPLLIFVWLAQSVGIL